MTEVIAGIRTIHETGLDRSTEIGSAIIVGRYESAPRNFVAMVFDYRSGKDTHAVFEREDMVALRDALNAELAS